MSPAREENLILCNATLLGGSLEITPEQLKGAIEATAKAGFAGVSLWSFHHMAAVTGGVSDEEVEAWHRDAGLSVPVVESLMGWETGDAAAIDEQNLSTLDIAQRYGASTVCGVLMSPEIESFDAAVSGFAHLARRAEERGLRICVEWFPWCALPDLETAWRLVEGTGCDNVGLVFDTWHWLRQPGGPDEETLRKIPGEKIYVVQLDDSPATGSGDDIMMESMTQRLLPGDGAVDFASLLAILDEIGADPIWAPEVFNLELMEQGPDEMARAIAASTRKVLGL